MNRRKECWRCVTTHNGKYSKRYEVSSMGRIRAHCANNIKGSKRGRVLFQGSDERGYKQVLLYAGKKNLRPTTLKVHRLVADAFLGSRQQGMTVNHIDGDKTNNNLENLEYISNKENLRHRYRVIKSEPSVVINGNRVCIPEAVERYGAKGVHKKMVSRRIHRHKWGVMEALTTPPLSTGISRENKIAKG